MPPKPAAPPAFGYQPHTDHGYQPHHVSYRRFRSGQRWWIENMVHSMPPDSEYWQGVEKEEEEKTNLEEEEHEEAEPEESSIGRTVNKEKKRSSRS